MQSRRDETEGVPCFPGWIAVTEHCCFGCFRQRDGTGSPSALNAVLAGMMVKHCNASAAFHHLSVFSAELWLDLGQMLSVCKAQWSHCFEEEMSIDTS